MIAPSDLDHVASAPFDRTLCREMERWFVEEYVPTWVEAGTAASADLRSILDYWGVPLHVSNPNGNQWLTTPGEVVEMLEAIQKPLKARGYSHTVIIDRRSTYYNERAISVDVIWSRRGENEREIERRAVHFEIRNLEGEYRIISIAACHTPESRLAAVFSYDRSDEE
jgi:hypothetical protein